MRTIIRAIAGFGDYFMSLSDRTRTQVILLALLLLGGGGVYKLVVGIQNLSKPLPAASPNQFVGPMRKLILLRPDNFDAYQKARRELDSLRSYQPQPNSLPR